MPDSPFETTVHLDPYYKSAAGDGRSPLRVGMQLLSSGEAFSPLMVIKGDALEHNLASMARYCTDEGIQLAMHGKTAMSPELSIAQLNAGAWGVSAATPSHVRVFRAFGVRNVLLANELVDPAGIRWIAEYQAAHPAEEFYCYVDSVAGVELLEAELASLPFEVVIDVLVEVGSEGGRTGARERTTIHEVARATLAARHLRLSGVAGYEGALASDRSAEATRRVRDYCEHVGAVAEELDRARLFETSEVILSVGGGAYFEIVVEVLKAVELPFTRRRIVIRSGSYLSHDDGLYARIAAFAQPGAAYTLQAALELWGRVLSRPEPTLAFLDFGRRDAPFDQDLPVPHAVRSRDGLNQRQVANFTITALNDQHAYLELPAEDPLAPGDWVASGISHPCTAFDKWRYIPVVDDRYAVVGTVTTYF
jgi:D-serine deaminase-like pyridoxal phosphate-dependent protein